MKFTPHRRRDGFLFCGQTNHDIAGEDGTCAECWAAGLGVATSTHMNTTTRTPLLCLPCARRYKDLYEAGFFALETIVGA